MKRLLTGTAIAALLATPVIAQSYSSETAEYFSNSTFSANVAELPEEYDAQDLNNIVLAKVERHYEENDVNRVTYVSKPNDAGERYATVTDTNDWLSGKNVGLLETAQSDERFTTLVSLIEMSADDLGLQEDEEYTIFAPVNDAFMQLSADRVNYLTSQMGARERTDILKAHIIPASIAAEDVPMKGTMLETLSGYKVWVMKAKDGTVTIGDATVVEGNIEASNGIIHAIDKIIMPTSL